MTFSTLATLTSLSTIEPSSVILELLSLLTIQFLNSASKVRKIKLTRWCKKSLRSLTFLSQNHKKYSRRDRICLAVFMLENCNINQQDRYKLRVNHNLSFVHSLCAWRFEADRFAPISVIQVFNFSE